MPIINVRYKENNKWNRNEKSKKQKNKKKIRGTGAIAKDQMIKWYN